MEQGGKSPFSLLSEPISPSSLNVNFSFSPSSVLFSPISPSSQLFLGHFSLLPILFLPFLLNVSAISSFFVRFGQSCFRNVYLWSFSRLVLLCAGSFRKRFKLTAWLLFPCSSEETFFAASSLPEKIYFVLK